MPFFFDPPYVKAGGRPYRHWHIGHLALFEQAARLKGDFLMTYDDHPEISELARNYEFELRRVEMKTTHHTNKQGSFGSHVNNVPGTRRWLIRSPDDSGRVPGTLADHLDSC